MFEEIQSIAKKEYRFSGDKKAYLVLFKINNNLSLEMYPKFFIFGFLIFFPTVIILNLELRLFAKLICRSIFLFL